MKKRALRAALILSLVSTFFIQFKYFEKKNRGYKKKLSHRLKVCEQIAGGFPFKSSLGGYKNFLPKQFDNLPLSNDKIVLGVKELDIRNVFAPYNASLIEQDNGYLVFFRYDLVKQMHLNLLNSYIGCAELDKDFNQTERDFVTVNMKSDYCEDPRAVSYNGNLSLVYNNLLPTHFYSRAMHVANLDLDKNEATNVEKIDLHLSKIEKNWAPFVYHAEDGSESLLFEYQIFEPRQILKYDSSSQSPQWIETVNTKDLNFWCSKWSDKWGHPLGGTGARLVDGEYLSFFHSKFKDKSTGSFWYVMGAYTFEAKPPFRITAMSKAPILFDGIYETPALNTASPDKYVIFPCGFAVEKKDEQTLLHVGCGENDSAIKILTIDKEALINSLQKIQ